jgi:PBP4 family serine-type D-alanyl-D-alanine carboxypeptidase
VAADPNMAAAHWGLVVQDESGKVLYQHGASELFVPASNLKLITAATALQVLGPDARFATELAASGSIDADGVLHGNLFLIGGGDPSLATDDLRGAVASLGIRKVAGDIVVDDHVFDDRHLGRGWAWDNLDAGYSAEVGGLMVDGDVARLRVSREGVTQSPPGGYLEIHDHTRAGSSTAVDARRALGTNVVEVDGTVAEPTTVAVSVHDPGLYAGSVLAALCRDRGIELSGKVVRGTAPTDARKLWEKSSEPLIRLERHMLKESDNLYAETLFHALADGQSSAAPEKERKALGLEEPFKVVDGSGLSRYDMVSPRMMGRVVQARYHDDDARDCLPVAGIDGTLKHRMKSLKGRVHAKTGTLDAVSSLCGWLDLRDGRKVSFAWFCNSYPDRIGGAKRVEDAVVEAIDRSLSEARR